MGQTQTNDVGNQCEKTVNEELKTTVMDCCGKRPLLARNK
jgi:hypothetical protein